MKLEDQFLTKSKFTKLIEKTVAELKIPYMDAIIKVCENIESPTFRPAEVKALAEQIIRSI